MLVIILWVEWKIMIMVKLFVVSNFSRRGVTSTVCENHIALDIFRSPAWKPLG